MIEQCPATISSVDVHLAPSQSGVVLHVPDEDAVQAVRQLGVEVYGQGSIKTGRILNYLNTDDENRKACSLFLSLMDRMGVQLDSFGDATTRLADL